MTATRRTPPTTPIDPAALYSGKEAARLLAALGAPLTPSTMTTYRHRSRERGDLVGPAFEMVGQWARYRGAALIAYAAARREAER